MNLISGKGGERFLVKSIDESPDTTRRLFEIGLHSRANIKIEKNDGQSPLLILVHGAVIALGREIGKNIKVERIEPCTKSD